MRLCPVSKYGCITVERSLFDPILKILIVIMLNWSIWSWSFAWAYGHIAILCWPTDDKVWHASAWFWFPAGPRALGRGLPGRGSSGSRSWFIRHHQSARPSSRTCRKTPKTWRPKSSTCRKTPKTWSVACTRWNKDSSWRRAWWRSTEPKGLLGHHGDRPQEHRRTTGTRSTKCQDSYQLANVDGPCVTLTAGGGADLRELPARLPTDRGGHRGGAADVEATCTVANIDWTALRSMYHCIDVKGVCVCYFCRYIFRTD